MTKLLPSSKHPRPLLVSLAVTMACGFALLAVYQAYLGPPSLVVRLALAAIALAFVVPAALLHARAISVYGPWPAALRQFGWLFALLVVLPNADMAFLLYVPDPPGWLAPLGWLMFFFGSLYYAVPAGIGGEGLFLLETVVSPLGWAGILLSAAFWTAVVVVVLSILQALALPFARRPPS